MTLVDWQKLLPVSLRWPEHHHRIEDGGGLPSTALCIAPRGVPAMQALRAKWFQRLCDSRDCLRVVAKLQSGHPGPPLPEVELQPYLDDLLTTLGHTAACESILLIAPGQPFRLQLWKLIAETWCDPDADFLDLLSVGVPLGVNEPLDPSPAWPVSQSALSDESPLMECTSSWKSALDNLPLVRESIAEEVTAGFIEHVPGGLDELQATYSKTAVGKLGLVIADGRSPRLVVDSSISNVTANTVLPNHMLLPRISDLIACTPCEMAQQVTQLTLDVSKAHRRILLRPSDSGLLCFHVGDDLYKCLTLNFGARASGWYWGRVAGLMIRSAHVLLDHHHTLWQYVDDLLSWLDRGTAPLWASALVILFLLLGIPLSWHKAALDSSLVWIGWSIDVALWTVQVPDEKLSKILGQVKDASKGKKSPLEVQHGISCAHCSFLCTRRSNAFLLRWWELTTSFFLNRFRRLMITSPFSLLWWPGTIPCVLA